MNTTTEMTSLDGFAAARRIPDLPLTPELRDAYDSALLKLMRDWRQIDKPIDSIAIAFRDDLKVDSAAAHALSAFASAPSSDRISVAVELGDASIFKP